MTEDESVYAALPVRLVPGSSTPKYLYLKRHKSTSGTEAAVAKRAIFVAGIPLQLTRPRLQELFSTFGTVDAVRTHLLFACVHNAPVLQNACICRGLYSDYIAKCIIKLVAGAGCGTMVAACCRFKCTQSRHPL